jgi:hypothetical protein
VGLALQVFWPGDRKWFAGVVTQFRPEDGLHHGERDAWQRAGVPRQRRARLRAACSGCCQPGASVVPGRQARATRHANQLVHCAARPPPQWSMTMAMPSGSTSPRSSTSCCLLTRPPPAPSGPQQQQRGRCAARRQQQQPQHSSGGGRRASRVMMMMMMMMGTAAAAATMTMVGVMMAAMTTATLQVCVCVCVCAMQLSCAHERVLGACRARTCWCWA